jgi:hypothetical protein
MSTAREGDRALSEPAAIAISAAVGLAVAFGSTYFFTTWADVFYEQVFRVGPTVAFDGVGSDWFVGNTKPWLNFLISLLHAADVLMGVFILLMVFIHWGAFRRLADRMQDPTYVDERAEEVYTDGGTGTEAGAGTGIGTGTDAGTGTGADADAGGTGGSTGDGLHGADTADAAPAPDAPADAGSENEEVPR